MPTSNPVALITGAAHRIGQCIAESLHQKGVDIGLHCHTSKKQALELMQVFNQARPNSCCLLQSDLAEKEAAKHLVSRITERFGRLDYLVNNASIFYPTPITEADPKSEQSLNCFMQINFLTPLKLCVAAFPHLQKAHGSIVNLIDIYANAGLSQHAEYTASKEALLSATKEMAHEFSPSVRVNGISPGAILWPELQQPSNEISQEQKDLQSKIIAETALKCRGKASDIANAAVYLLLDASYTTGTTIAVDGGRQLYI